MGDEEFDRRRCYGGSLQDGRSYRRDRERDYEGDRERRIRNNDYSNVSNLKRSGSGRRDDGIKRSRIDSACDSFEPQFNRSAPEGPIVPVMMTFKKFLATQDDSISGEDAISKYSEYKRKELQTFFDSHKDEEWFRFKYHPSETKKQKDAPLNLTILTEQDLANLGKKDPEKEVEKFIAANSVELAKDKWLCPLSGKKFRGPEFIKKHLTLKYQEQLDLIKVEAEFFNNYIADPKRPHEAEQKPLATPSSEDRRVHDGPSERERDGGHRSSYGDRSRYSGSNRSFGGYNRPRVYEPPADIRRDPRQPVTYRDLDAPEDIF